MSNINKAYDHKLGYGMLETKLLSIFQKSGPPDFAAADELIRLGADINAEGDEYDGNILFEILCGYQCWQTDDGHEVDDELIGEYMLQVIHYFLDHGFDVNRKNGLYGAQCLYGLVLSMPNRAVVEATKLFIKAGAKDLYIDEEQTEGEKASSFLGAEITFQSICEHNYHISNSLEAAYQIHVAVENQKPYDDIDSYEAVLGKKIERVLIEKSVNGRVLHDVILSNGRFGKCFYTRIFFLFEDRMMIATPYVDFWTDKYDPSIKTLDISSEFSLITGSSVEKVMFNYNGVSREMSHYTQPVATFVMKNGSAITFTTSFGEVPDDTSTAYFYFGQPIIRKENEPGIDRWWNE